MAAPRPTSTATPAPPIALAALLRRLRDGGIHYRLDQHRDGAIMVEVAVPGERWEVEFLEDGSVEAERFRSDGTIHDATALDGLIARHADPA